MAEYRKPSLTPGEDRRPVLTWPRQLPFDGEPTDVVAVVAKNAEWMQLSPVPKLWIKGDPGAIMSGAETVKFWEREPNQTTATVKGLHFLQESSGPEVGAAIAQSVRRRAGRVEYLDPHVTEFEGQRPSPLMMVTSTLTMSPQPVGRAVRKVLLRRS